MVLFNFPLRAWFAALSLGALGLVAVGLELQTMLRLSPCPLCIFQRLLYIVIGLFALGGVCCPRAAKLWAAGLFALSGLGVGVAAYQSWMQAFPELAKECSFTDPGLIERVVDWLGMQYPSLFMATGFCTSREWEMFGLSMANWSLLVFAGIAACALVLLRQRQA